VSRLRSIWLVARRELQERGRSRGFLFSLAFTTIIIIGSFVIPVVLFEDDGVRRIGLTQPVPAGLTTAIVEHGDTLDQELEVSELGDPAAAAAALESGEVDVLVEVPADLADAGTIRFQEEVDPALTQAVVGAIVELRSDAVLASAGVAPSAVEAAQAPPAIVIAEPPDPDEGQRFFIANIGAVLILVGVFGFGFTVLTGVVEEKQSRVVEVVLATVRARDLLMGKVLGIGILGLIQLAVFVAAALIAALATQRVTLPTTTPSAVALLAVWFILGYALYATVLGALAALASRTEEASNVSTPVTMVAIISYLVAIIGVAQDPSGTVATLTTFLPPTAPFVIPLRAAFDAIPAWEIGVSMAIMLVTIWLLFEVGARIYTGAVLQTTGRMKLRDAWRAGR
jgi:ABC-2 type transport system permease protein